MQHIPTEDAQVLADEVWERCLGSRVTRLHRLLSLRYDQALAAVGLTLPQVEILSALVKRGRPVGASEMGRNLVVGRSAMSRKLGALEERGWIETAQRSDSGRSMAWSVTPDGVAVLGGALAAWRRVQARTEAELGAEVVSEVDGWLVRLTDAAEA